MRKWIIGAVVACVAASPAAAFGHSSHAKDKASKKPNAAQKCRAERAADPAAFKLKYGTNENKSNAFGKCVSAQKKHKHATTPPTSTKQGDDQEKSKDESSAEAKCRTERDADADAFKTKYGTNENKANAFGKCVSGQSKQQGEDSDSDDDDQGEQHSKGDQHS